MSIKLLKQLALPIIFSRLATRLFAKTYDQTIPIFVLHQFDRDGHDLNQLIEGVKYLKSKGFEFVSIRQLIEKLENNEKTTRNIVLTIDDGYHNQFEAAKRLVEECNIHVSMCVINDLVFGGDVPWDMRIKHAIRFTEKKHLSLPGPNGLIDYALGTDEEKHDAIHEIRSSCELLHFQQTLNLVELIESQLTEDRNSEFNSIYKALDINRLKEYDNIDVIPHTMSHCVLASEDGEFKKCQIAESIQQYEDFFGHKILSFAYPLGKIENYDFETIKLMNEAGIKMALTTVGGYFNRETWVSSPYLKYQIPRFGYPNSKLDFLIVSSWLGRAIERYHGFNLKKYVQNEFGNTREFGRFVYFLLADRLTYGRKMRSLDRARIRRVIFICKGNICRSPFAEIVMKSAGFQCMSAGIYAKDGAVAHPGALKTALLKSYDLSNHKSINIKNIEITNSDLLVFMESPHILEMQELIDRTNAQYTLLGIWDSFYRPYISDPYGKTREYFMTCFNVIERSTLNLSRFVMGA